MENKDKKEEILMKNNVITKAKFNLTTVENRVFQLVMYKLQKKGVGVLECSITLDEFRKIIKNKNQLSAEAITEILTELRKQSIFFKKTKEEQNLDKTSKKPFSVWGEWGIINGHMYDEETETFTIEASEKVHSLLHEYLQGGYTPINLSVFFGLSNSYAQRFYDLLRLWSYKKKVITYSLDELKELLMVEGKYPRFVDFKRRILNPAIKELTETGMFQIEVKENRKGRAVESLDFIVTDLDKRVYGLKKKEVLIEEASEEVVVDSDSEAEIEGESEKIETKIPEQNFIAKPLHHLIKVHFKGINFAEDNEYYMLFAEAEATTLLKHNVEKITTMQEFAYFRNTLKNKCDMLRKEQSEKNKYDNLEAKLLGWE